MTARREIVVVGAGSSGCVVAERLSRSGADSVVLVEAGGPAPEPVDLSVLPVRDGARVWHHRDTEGTELPRGRGVGGSSAVNGGYFLRPHRDDLAAWDPDLWGIPAVERAFDTLDGGAGGGGVMTVRRFTDDELHPRAVAFERAMRADGHVDVDGVWPEPGIVRVRTNARGRHRTTAADAFLADARHRRDLLIRNDVRVERIEMNDATVRSVVTDSGERIPADVVVLCAGTLATAGILHRSGSVPVVVPLAEHRELLVRCRARGDDGDVSPVLQSVMHTDDGMEIRCYSHDFAAHITGLEQTGPAIGVAAMRPGSAGSIRFDADGGAPEVDLGRPDDETRQRMQVWAERMATVLDGPAFAHLVAPGSVTVDDRLATSHHAWGTAPMGGGPTGVGTDWRGRVVDHDGLYVADGSVLPTPLSSGPHATVMMVASVIADRIGRERD